MKSITKIIFICIALFGTVSIISSKAILKFLNSHYLIEGQFSTVLFNKAINATSQTDDYVAIVASYIINPVHRDSSYLIQAYAKISSNGVPINAGQLSIGSTLINPDSNNYYHYTYPISNGKLLFGTSQSVSFNTEQSRIQRIASQVIVVPKEFFPSSVSLPGTTVDRTSNYQLNWAPDPNNEFQKVQIQVSYYKGISQYSASGMPNSITDLVYTASDNGSYVIPQTDLARYPAGAYIGISITRAWLDSTSGNTEYVALMQARTIPLLVIGGPIVNTMAINGPDLVCTSGNYSINNLPVGMSVAWSLSPSYVGTLTCTSCAQTTINKYAAGNITLTATVSNSSTSYLLNKSVHIGGYGSGDYPVSGPSSASCNGYVTYTTNQLPGATNYSWFYPGGWTYVSGQGTYMLTLIAKGTSSGYYQVGVRVANSCDAGGSYAIKNTYFSGCSGYYYSVSPNPATSTVTINTLSSNSLTTSSKSTSATQHLSFSEVNIYDETGNLKKHLVFNKVKSTVLNIADLPIGIYTVEIIDGSYKERKQLEVLK